MANPSPPQVRVGVGVFILQNPSSISSRTNNTTNPTFLIGRRLGSHGSGTQALPGGHLEFGESFSDCAAREVLEETGLKVTNIRFLTATNDVMEKEGKHYVTIFMVCEREDEKEEARVLEPEKCEGWEWVDWETLVNWARGELGVKVFLPLVNLVGNEEGKFPRVN